MNIGIRAVTPNDESFIFESWLKGYRYGSSIGRGGMRNSIFYGHHHEVIAAILRRNETTGLVAHDLEDPSLIFGFLVYEKPNTIHWCHVKRDFRRHGIAGQLVTVAGFPLDLKGVELSHVSDDWHSFLKQKCPGALYNLYRQFWPRDTTRQRPASACRD